MQILLRIMLPVAGLFVSASLYAQIKNPKTDTVKIYGNCGMCESVIEKAGSMAGIAEADWDRNTKMATLLYDSKKIGKDEILKRIAAAGYDNERFTVPDKAYGNLHDCCQYERSKK